MKRLKMPLAVLFALLCVSGVSFSAENASEKEKTEAVKQEAAKINLAVSDFEGRNVEAADAASVSDLMRTGFVNTGKFIVVNRGNMQQILQEQSLQASGITSEEYAAKIGKLLNVQKVVVGTVSKLGQNYYINASMVDVETSKIDTSKKIKAESLENLAEKTETLAEILAGIRKGELPEEDAKAAADKKTAEKQKAKIDLDLGGQVGIYYPSDSNLAQYHNVNLLYGFQGRLWVYRIGLQYESETYANTYNGKVGTLNSLSQELTLTPQWTSLLIRGKYVPYGFIGYGVGSMGVKTVTKMSGSGNITSDKSVSGYQVLVGAGGKHANIMLKYSSFDKLANVDYGGISVTLGFYF
ncbi:MAG TPA: hypothetical protein DEE98_01655 [Elusimicrobia bacterium]|nr:MAG: hypothetical protein A2278_06060 [Elusimicrobia bacterium RIFOXYA12_FULL_49_49]OGS08389.1 MAG: hypothetical protein A2204_08270 [Elusimicrobia bacterium RIFOXYA1_FULL_47_7]OGS10338.1 MAG: hypothetical protein A2386_04740 [Elusimicrobia bacterium RIFOXYB1_FULL_48_9]OGS16644.1 MAG: hypothetical protein A2251_04675 [Elusimicrobia bacterium RIFOXYA2_FULL_47_53]OGS25493.1 MAG: hypothetical protein A2339_00250 [Elusimicrobia bacterium RIFOXYB12_FULL_50_12]OGS31622.1 MAG: hypothetical protein